MWRVHRSVVIQTLQEWKADVQILARLPRDRHIGVIQGYCAHEESRVERLLVFEQSPCGTLHDYLGGRRQSNPTLARLDWPLRIGILLGAARGLLYIHDRAPAQILYRDLKAASVLLDQDYTPRLAGYGLAVTSWPSAADNKSSFSTVCCSLNPLICCSHGFRIFDGGGDGVR
jgi:serine/threonine protein kinase